MSTPAQSIWSDATADAIGKANTKAAPLTGHPSGTDGIWSSAVNDARGVQTPTPPIPPITGTERAMQQGLGGPPMWVDVPKGQGQAFEQAGQKGYQTGGLVGAGLVAGAGTAAAAAPAAIAAAGTLGELAEAHPVAAYVIKRLVDGGLLSAGWRAINLIGKATK